MLTVARRLTALSGTRLTVWLAASCGDAKFPATSVTAEYKLPAFAPAGRHSAGLMYVNQSASGGSFVAGLEGEIAPATTAGELILRIGVPRILEAPEAEAELLGSVIAGVRAVPPERRPAGTLELTRFAVHPADFKTRRWQIAASLLNSATGGAPDGENDRLLREPRTTRKPLPEVVNGNERCR